MDTFDILVYMCILNLHLKIGETKIYRIHSLEEIYTAKEFQKVRLLLG